jgi:hypothetical protein
MARTIRRTSGDRNWMKLDSDVEWVKGVRLRYGCKNYSEWWNQEKHWYKPLKIQKKFGVYETLALYPVRTSLKKLDVKRKSEIERDRGNWNRGKRTYKEAVNESDRACCRKEIHKIRESCYRGFDDIYEYDPSFENAVQRSLIWSIF